MRQRRRRRAERQPEDLGIPPAERTAREYSEPTPFLTGLQSSLGNKAVQSLLSSSTERITSTTRAPFEAGLGRSFADVRVHHGGNVDAALAAVEALAVTREKDIYLHSSSPPLDSQAGQALLGEELVHVVQGVGTAEVERITSPNETAESEARLLGAAAARGTRLNVPTRAAARNAVARQASTTAAPNNRVARSLLTMQEGLGSVTQAIGGLFGAAPRLNEEDRVLMYNQVYLPLLEAQGLIIEFEEQVMSEDVSPQDMPRLQSRLETLVGHKSQCAVLVEDIARANGTPAPLRPALLVLVTHLKDIEGYLLAALRPRWAKKIAICDLTQVFKYASGEAFSYFGGGGPGEGRQWRVGEIASPLLNAVEELKKRQPDYRLVLGLVERVQKIMGGLMAASPEYEHLELYASQVGHARAFVEQLASTDPSGVMLVDQKLAFLIPMVKKLV